ncbi:hypothetical protein NM208_g8429 [Fusarium decemcellulare]|uniref:Uncharacterized protein n=1 Tax=Fusarium decemcellulare TaxID=57161 RepID=A0ACC1S5Y3_9HYPO|nr:hypothetical protein NM208_g8429 [Fusarium decemcellulare]
MQAGEGHGQGWFRINTIKGAQNAALFKWPDQSNEPECSPIPVEEELLPSLNQLADNPKCEALPCYIGRIPHEDLSNILHCGAELWACLKDITQVGKPDCNIAPAGSCTPFDGGPGPLWYANLTVSGSKIWLVIETSSNDKLLGLLNGWWPEGKPKCHDWVRHLALFLSPARLDQEDIRYQVYGTVPGKMVVFKPGEYYLGMNFSQAATVSTHFVPPGTELLPRTIPTCQDCRLSGLEGPQVGDMAKTPKRGKKRGRPRGLQSVKGGKKKTVHVQRQDDEILEEEDCLMDAVVEEIQEVDPYCLIPSRDKIEGLQVETFQLATLLWGRLALRQFIGLVTAWRTRGAVIVKGPGDSITRNDRILRCMSSLGNALDNSKLAKLQIRLAEFHLAHEINDIKAKGILKFTEKMCAKAGLPMWKFEKHRARGNHWMALCRDPIDEEAWVPGLLCLIPLESDDPFFVTDEDYHAIDEEQLEIMYDLFDDLSQFKYFKTINNATEAFVAALSESSSIKFKFEDEEGPLNWGEMEETEIVKLLTVERR